MESSPEERIRAQARLVAANTERAKNKWCAAFDEWRHSTTPPLAMSIREYIDLDDPFKLDEAMSRFAFEVRMQSPNADRPFGFEFEYTPASLDKCFSSLQATIRDIFQEINTRDRTNRPHWVIETRRGGPNAHPAFEGTRNTLDRRINALTRARVGVKVNKAKAVPGVVNDALYASNDAMPVTTPVGLQDRLVYLLMELCIRSATTLYNMCPSRKFPVDSDSFQSGFPNLHSSILHSLMG